MKHLLRLKPLNHVLRHPWVLYGMAAVLALVGLLLAGLWSTAVPSWDDRLTSMSWRFADSERAERRVVVIDIDEKSVQALGPWPWPRTQVAELLGKLDQQQVGLKIVDILFEGQKPDDAVLARALGQGAPTVIAQLLPLSADPAVASGQPSGALTGACPSTSTPGYGHMAPPVLLAQASAAVGHITPVVDADGGIRRIPALVCVDGKAYPALPLAALAVALNEPLRMQTTPGWNQPFATVGVGGLDIPIDAQGQLRISYQQPRQGLISLSALDVLTGKVPPELLKGAWVLVGSTALGAGDAVTTPQGGIVGGVEIHAQIIAAVLDGRTPYAPKWAPFWPWASALFSLILLGASLLRWRKRAGVVLPLVAGVNILSLVALHLWLLLDKHLWLGWMLPVSFVLLATGLLIVAEWLRVRLEHERLFDTLSSYLPEAAAQRVAFAEPCEQVQAERRLATVMFIDLRNYSAYCEGRSPEDAATVLHLFYTTVDAIVRERGGVIEQMVGDSVIAVWNGSKPCPEHARQALTVAEPIWRQVNAQLPKVSTHKIPPLDVGIGLETGDVLVGSFGPARRRVHTVLGETVSVAARLQAMTADLGYPVLLGPAVAKHAVADSTIHLGDFILNGMQTARTLYALPIKIPSSHLHLVYPDAPNDERYA